MPDRVVTMTEIDRLRVRANAALNNLRALVHAGWGTGGHKHDQALDALKPGDIS